MAENNLNAFKKTFKYMTSGFGDKNLKVWAKLYGVTESYLQVCYWIAQNNMEPTKIKTKRGK